MSAKMPVIFAVLCCAMVLACGGARAAEADEHGHGHEETSATAGQQCPGEEGFIAAFNSEAASLNISDHDGHHCMIEDDHDHHGDDDDHKEDNSTDTDHEEGPSCDAVAQLVRRVILQLNLTTEECLEHGHNETTAAPTSRSTSAEAYGYGFLMTFIVCLGALGGIAVIPLIHTKSPIAKLIYGYAYAFMVALAVSALVSDALLHLVPLVFGLHAHHGEEEAEHDHEEESREYLWKACVVLAGIYIFYLLELILHGFTNFLKARSAAKDREDRNETALSDVKNGSAHNNDDETKDTKEFDTKEQPDPKICDLSCRRIRPVAWLIIIGDAMHNFADGLAIGAAVSVSVTLGVGTSLAILLHEIPHELGDYAILIKSGIHWFTALLFNFLSALTAIIGLFIGVAISQSTAAATEWILAITAGLFLYIGLVDLLPELIHGDGDNAKWAITNWRWWLRFLIINLGFFVSFAVLLLLAVYEEQIRF